MEYNWKKSIYNQIDNNTGHDRYEKFIYSYSFPFSKELNNRTKLTLVPGATLIPDTLGERNIGGNFYGNNLGIGISSLIYLFTPQLVLLGGGVAAAAEYFLPSVKTQIEKRVQFASREGLIIRTCELGNKAGCLGAALTAIQRI